MEKGGEQLAGIIHFSLLSLTCIHNVQITLIELYHIVLEKRSESLHTSNPFAVEKRTAAFAL